jgi:hypothetical protein
MRPERITEQRQLNAERPPDQRTEGSHQRMVSLRQESFDEAIRLLDLMTEFHETDPKDGECWPDCIACNAETLLADMKKQANDQAQRPEGQ